MTTIKYLTLITLTCLLGACASTRSVDPTVSTVTIAPPPSGLDAVSESETSSPGPNADWTLIGMALDFYAEFDGGGQEVTWDHPDSSMQAFIDMALARASDLDNVYKEGEVFAMAAPSASPINKEAEKRGFSIRLDENGRGLGVYVGVFSLIAPRWSAEGANTVIPTLDDRYWHGFKLSGAEHEFMTGLLDGLPVVSVLTSEGGRMYYYMPEEIPTSAGETRMLAQAMLLTPLEADEGMAKAGVYLPDVDMDELVDITALEGAVPVMQSGDELTSITQALQQTKLKQDRCGVTVESAVLIAGTRALQGLPVIINRPFMIVYQRPDAAIETFALFVDEQYFSEASGVDDVKPEEPCSS